MRNVQNPRGNSCGHVPLLLLRIAIGWHFAYEGLNKVLAPWSSAGYLRAATGPMKQMFASIAAQAGLLAAVDVLMSWGMLVLGVLFMLGAFTRISGSCLMAMLAMFYLSQPPWSGSKQPAEEGTYLYVNKNLIEFLAIAAVICSGVSRTWGMDGLFRRRRESAARQPSEDVPR